MQKSGFREVAHTADWEIEAWAEDLSGLFSQCAIGMYGISGVRTATVGRRARRILTLEGLDPESLLVRFLNELLHFAEKERLGFDLIDLQFRQKVANEELSLVAILNGRRIATQNKEIKAVTYHNLRIRKTPKGLSVNVVFDV